jgi:hypothetical protein
VTFAAPAFFSTIWAVLPLTVTAAILASADENIYDVPGTSAPFSSTALAVTVIVSPATPVSDVALSVSFVARYATTTVAFAFEELTRAVIVVVPTECAVIVPSSETLATPGSEDDHSIPDGVVIGEFSDIAETVNLAVLPAPIESETKIVSGVGESDSESPSGANALVVESLEQADRTAAASEDHTIKRRTERITISLGDWC